MKQSSEGLEEARPPGRGRTALPSWKLHQLCVATYGGSAAPAPPGAQEVRCLATPAGRGIMPWAACQLMMCGTGSQPRIHRLPIHGIRTHLGISVLLEGKEENRTTSHPCPRASTGEVPVRAGTVLGAPPEGSGERAGGYKVCKSYVHTLQSLHSSPIRHEVDLSSSRGEGRKRKEGECAVQKVGEEEAGAGPVSSRGRAPRPSSP